MSTWARIDELRRQAAELADWCDRQGWELLPAVPAGWQARRRGRYGELDELTAKTPDELRRLITERKRTK